MESLLEKIYSGQVEIVGKTIDRPEYKMALAAYEKLYGDFKAALTSEQRDVLEKLMDSHSNLHTVIEKHIFRQGGKLGVGLILEFFHEWLA